MPHANFRSGCDPTTPDGKRSGRRRWGIAALLIYLWGWLAVWLLAGFIGDTGPLVSILRIVYWPLIKLGMLSFRFGSRI